ncbi:hypothetical protein EVAR_38682_1 [Eumeta japonica]|uniref:Uncharacterized protein n=1 Tax=Eumeta variegata TaxID=151549 RepID=A0A4C1YAT5_EUMVA|nr:hypothetical protein EVAR_38682_1 [Eumeta japonica]
MRAELRAEASKISNRKRFQNYYNPGAQLPHSNISSEKIGKGSRPYKSSARMEWILENLEWRRLRNRERERIGLKERRRFKRYGIEQNRLGVGGYPKREQIRH